MAGCHNVEDIDSRSQHGQSTVTVKYKRGTNMDFARLELSEQLGAVRRELPDRAGQPFIRAYVPEELRAEALAALPPEEGGDFLPSDLVELTTLDSTIRLDR